MCVQFRKNLYIFFTLIAIPYRTKNHVRSQIFSSQVLKEEYPQFNTKAGMKSLTSTDSKDTEIEEDRMGQREALGIKET
jgi:hypothetical protein